MLKIKFVGMPFLSYIISDELSALKEANQETLLALDETAVLLHKNIGV